METVSRNCTSNDVTDEDEAAVLKRIKDVIYLQRTSPNFAMYCVSHVTDRKHSFLFYNDDHTAVDDAGKRKPAIRADQNYWARKRYVELLDDARQREHKNAKFEECDYNNNIIKESDDANFDNTTNNKRELLSHGIAENKNAITLFRRTWRVYSPQEAKRNEQCNDFCYTNCSSISKSPNTIDYDDDEFHVKDKHAIAAMETRYLTLHDIRHIWDGLCRICRRFATSRRNNPTWLSQPPPYNFVSFKELTEFVEKTLYYVILQEREKLTWFVEHITRVHLIHTEAILYTLVYIVEELLSFAREQWSCEDAKKRVWLQHYSYNNTKNIHDVRNNLQIGKKEEGQYDYEEAAGTVFYLIILLFDTHRKREATLQSTLQNVTSTHMSSDAMQNSSHVMNNSATLYHHNNKNIKGAYYQAAFEQYCVKAVEAVLYHYYQYQRRVKWQQTYFAQFITTTAPNECVNGNTNSQLAKSSSSPLFDFVINVLES